MIRTRKKVTGIARDEDEDGNKISRKKLKRELDAQVGEGPERLASAESISPLFFHGDDFKTRKVNAFGSDSCASHIMRRFDYAQREADDQG